MSSMPFEYEERYKVIDFEKVHSILAAAGFTIKATESQTDHWFIPNRITSPDEQAQWFDYEEGYALRIREETTSQGKRNIITAKQLLAPGDHSAMTNHESDLTILGVRRVLSAMGKEFDGLLQELRDREDDESLTYIDLKHLIEQSGRKEYITLHKERISFRNPSIRDVEVDLDRIPALQSTTLGYYATIELEYTGNASPEKARSVVGAISRSLGYDPKDALSMALPGQAIPYLAKF